MDITAKAHVAEAFANIARIEGGVDLLVNNVGNYNPQHVTQLDPSVWDATIASNLSGAYYCCFHALRLLRDEGNIINIGMAGLEGIRANVFGADYYVSKTGLLVLTQVAIAPADWPRLDAALHAARALPMPRVDVEEALLQGTLFFGFPRLVSAFERLQAAWPAASPPQGGSVQFETENRVDPSAVIRLIQRPAQDYRMDGPLRLRFSRRLSAIPARFEYAAGLLAVLGGAPPPAPAKMDA